MPAGPQKDLLLVYLGPPSSGGTVQVLARLGRLWSQSDSRVEFVTYSDAGVLDAEDLPIVRIGPAPNSRISGRPLRVALRQARSVVRYAVRIRRAVRERPHAVILPFLTGTALVTLAATIGLPNRVVVCERIDVSARSLTWHFRLLQHLLYPRASAFTINSSSQAASRLLRSISRGRPVHVVPNPLPRDIPSADPAASHTILAVGRLADQKQHAVLIDAFSRIADRIPEWCVVILGEGPLRSDLGAQINRLGLADRITLTGQVDDPRPFYASAGLFVLPSGYEGTSNALLEAASAGLPCIVSEETAPPHTEGVLMSVPAGSADALAEGLLDVCLNTDKREVLGRAAERWVKQVSDDDVLEGWSSVLELSVSNE